MFNYNKTIIKGLRILVSKPPMDDQYYVHYEFTGTNWRESAKFVLPNYIGQQNVKIQTLHQFSSVKDNIWVYNEGIFVCDL
jgi:hypothetical protein